MRFVARQSDGPKFLTEPTTTEAIEEFGAFLDEGGLQTKQMRSQDWTDIARPGSDDLLAACTEQFSGKCAFTEVALPDAAFENLHHFRPERGATDWPSGDSALQSYWWLMGDWNNLYLASHDVRIAKSTFFPVRGPRAESRDSEPDAAILLDPCRDRPEWYLRFRMDGTVEPLPLVVSDGVVEAGSIERGAASIQLYGLSSDRLVQSRRQALTEFLGANGTSSYTDVADYLDDHRDWSLEQILDSLYNSLSELELSSPHLGAVWQVAAELFVALMPQIVAEPVGSPIRERSAELVEGLTPELARLAWSREGLGDLFVRAFAHQASEIFDAGRTALANLNHELDPIDGESLQVLRPIDAPAGLTVGSLGGVVIDHFSIKNFKAIRDVRVDIATSPDPQDQAAVPARIVRNPRLPIPGRYLQLALGGKLLEPVPVTPGKVFIGENGSGKSSVLQALALGLISDQARDGLGLNLKKFINTTDGVTAEAAEVQVTLVGGFTFDLRIPADGEATITGTSSNGEPVMTQSAEDWFLIRAYSATRTLKASTTIDEADGYEVANLFNPHRTLVDPEDWLASLSDEDFNVVATTLRTLFETDAISAARNAQGFEPVIGPGQDETELALTREVRVDVDDKPVLDDDGNKRIDIFVHGDPIGSLSDGYRAIVSLFCDIMAGAAEHGADDMKLARGIVLIDEIGAHLHPRWRMQISGLLRREFPLMQIIVSTHEPLCLRGFVEDEVIKVYRDVEGDPVLQPIDRSPSSYRVDQLLTSEFFGLQSTVDPDENDRLHLFYQLLAKGEDELTPELKVLLEEVRPAVRNQAFGSSYREQLTYQAVDRYITERYRGVTDPAHKLKDEMFAEVSDIWRSFDIELEQLEQGGEGHA